MTGFTPEPSPEELCKAARTGYDHLITHSECYKKLMSVFYAGGVVYGLSGNESLEVQVVTESSEWPVTDIRWKRAASDQRVWPKTTESAPINDAQGQAYINGEETNVDISSCSASACMVTPVNDSQPLVDGEPVYYQGELLCNYSGSGECALPSDKKSNRPSYKDCHEAGCPISSGCTISSSPFYREVTCDYCVSCGCRPEVNCTMTNFAGTTKNCQCLNDDPLNTIDCTCNAEIPSYETIPGLIALVVFGSIIYILCPSCCITAGCCLNRCL